LVVAGSKWACPEPSIAVGEDHGVAIARLIGLPRRKGFRPAARDPLAETLIRKILDWWRPEIVHLQHWSRLTNNLVAICFDFKIPTVVTLHDQWIACSRHHRVRLDEVFCADRTAPCASCVDRDPWQSVSEIERELALRERTIEQELRLADRLLVPSQAQQAFLHTIAGIPLERLEVMQLGSPRAESKRVDHDQPRSNGAPIKVGFWGYLLPEKGVHLLLEAARRLSRGMGVEWHVYGSAADPAYQARLKQLAEGLPVKFHDKYVFHSLQSANLDLAVFPSLCCETHSFVLDEAFQLGLPVLASNRGAFCERLGKTGLLFECGDAGDLAAKVESLLENPTALSRLKQAAAEGKVVSMDDHVEGIEKIYQEVVDSYVPRAVPKHNYREILLHQHQQLIDRDRKIERLMECVAERDDLLRAERAALEREVASAKAERAALEREVASAKAELQVVRDRLVEMGAEEARLRQIVATLEEEREWWRKQTKLLEDDFDRLRRTPLHQLYALLGKLN
jgi:glycosyltransferase involved in cell wall biosynthesis